MSTVPKRPVASWVVYALRDPETSELRYVGTTTMSLGVRVRAHCNSSRECPGTPKEHWIADLLHRGLRPAAEVLESHEGQPTATLVLAREAHWIATLRQQGADLLNASNTHRAACALAVADDLPRTAPERLRHIILRRRVTYAEAAREIGCQPGTVEGWASDWFIPRDAWRLRIEAWTDGEVPADLWGPSRRRGLAPGAAAADEAALDAIRREAIRAYGPACPPATAA